MIDRRHGNDELLREALLRCPFWSRKWVTSRKWGWKINSFRNNFQERKNPRKSGVDWKIQEEITTQHGSFSFFLLKEFKNITVCAKPKNKNCLGMRARERERVNDFWWICQKLFFSFLFKKCLKKGRHVSTCVRLSRLAVVELVTATWLYPQTLSRP